VSDQEIELLIETFKRGIGTRPDRAVRLIDLAGLVASKKYRLKALELCRQALEAGTGAPEINIRARRLLSAIVEGYHTQVINDRRRGAAWERALRRAIRPGARVLEIGTGAGLLALMAARAGAAKVTACERDPVMAAVAREIVDRNGYSDRIDVVAKNSRDLAIGIDLDRPAELLFCDIFANDMLGWEPLRVLADARRLLAPGSRVIPAAGAICIALAVWSGYERFCRVDGPAGFDMSPFGSFVSPAVGLEIGDPGLALLSHDTEAFRFDFAAASQTQSGRMEVVLEATQDCNVQGIAEWTRLELDADTVLEARPAPGTTFYQSPLFYPLPQPIALQRGGKLRVGVAHDGRRLIIWPIGAV
jgi:SAM-dependent methyltransferase